MDFEVLNRQYNKIEPQNIEESNTDIDLERERERANFSKRSFELPLFRGQILQTLPYCIARLGGWDCPQDSCYVFRLYPFSGGALYIMFENHVRS
jgi:hypothetical protein